MLEMGKPCGLLIKEELKTTLMNYFNGLRAYHNIRVSKMFDGAGLLLQA